MMVIMECEFVTSWLEDINCPVKFQFSKKKINKILFYQVKIGLGEEEENLYQIVELVQKAGFHVIS